jgi:DNA invertase Pin-like site-specific DNA recombinase
VVILTRIDRLTRSTFDLFAIVRQIVDAGGQFRSLAEPWADTGTSIGRLMIAVLSGRGARPVRHLSAQFTFLDARRHVLCY